MLRGYFTIGTFMREFSADCLAVKHFLQKKRYDFREFIEKDGRSTLKVYLSSDDLQEFKELLMEETGITME